MTRTQPTNAKILATMNGQHHMCLYYRNKNIGECHTDYVFVDTKDVVKLLGNRKVLMWNGVELIVD